MSSPTRDKNDKYINSMKHYVDIAMGLLYLFISVYMLKIPTLAERYGASAVYIFMGLFSLYGLYRIGRGIVALMKIMKPRR
ncbi:MAG: hypothetical protein IPL09_10395 [Bacteroidetes bacterium]|jgi:hypothetical protein|nr:hypothetical protein [Bacteroidota bacterium]HQW47348.1 hypothetical protein [Chitinophagaceae bacterium]MBK6819718.1 hypothetical protein [Bacteroidota bacterium]MBK7039576.1 hypothetical protein [Bacteroidota bacterium]MBK7587380.1 hypothetical protein [Bacteroidota bacterium]